MFKTTNYSQFSVLAHPPLTCSNHSPLSALQTKLNEEKSARQKADQNSQEKERQISMLSVDYRQIQQRLQKLEGEFRQVSLASAQYTLQGSLNFFISF